MSAIKNLIADKCAAASLNENQEKMFWDLLNKKSPGFNFCYDVESQINWAIEFVKHDSYLSE